MLCTRLSNSVRRSDGSVPAEQRHVPPSIMESFNSVKLPAMMLKSDDEFSSKTKI